MPHPAGVPHAHRVDTASRSAGDRLVARLTAGERIPRRRRVAVRPTGPDARDDELVPAALSVAFVDGMAKLHIRIASHIYTLYVVTNAVSCGEMLLVHTCTRTHSEFFFLLGFSGGFFVCELNSIYISIHIIYSFLSVHVCVCVKQILLLVFLLLSEFVVIVIWLTIFISRKS